VTGRRVLVTGGAGFIGAHVVRALAQRGDDVVIADWRPCAEGGFESVLVDLRDADAIDRVLQAGVDTVVHLAAATSVLRSVERPAETFATNAAVTAALLERARQIDVRTFVFASTNAVVGVADHVPLNERSPLLPLTPYGATKAAAEMLLSGYASAYGMRCPALRFTNVYGPSMGTKDSIVPRLMNAARSGSTFEVYGDGRHLRDYVYVDDVVSAVLLAMNADASGPIVIGSGTSTSVLELTTMVRDITGAPLRLRHVAPKPGEMARVVVDNALAGRLLGWRPAVGLLDGLARVWASWPDSADVADVVGPVGAGARVGIR
jgi:UDP-glucose 4-epimerase